jgi:hypothetical protein
VTSLAPASVSCTASTDATIHSTGIYIATTDDPLVESSFKIKIATKTSRRHRVRIEFEVEIHRLPSTSRIEFVSTLTSSRTRWPLWFSTSSFSSIASGRGECRDSYHHETHTGHIYISHTYHTYIYSIGQTSTRPSQAVFNVIQHFYLIIIISMASSKGLIASPVVCRN